MADEEENVEEETIELEDSEAKPRSKKKLILLALAFLVLIGASVGGTLFFLSTGDEENTENVSTEEGSEESTVEGEGSESEPLDENNEGESEKARALYYPLKPPYIVNIDARGRRRYLQAELTLSTREEDVIAAIEMHKPSVDHTVNIILSGHVFEDIQTAEGKELLRLELTKSLQDLLTEEIGKPGIEQVLFTNFVMQ